MRRKKTKTTLMFQRPAPMTALIDELRKKVNDGLVSRDQIRAALKHFGVTRVYDLEQYDIKRFRGYLGLT